jgi:hypothetical protein
VVTDAALLIPVNSQFEGFVWDDDQTKMGVKGYNVGLPGDPVKMSGGLSHTVTGLKVIGDPRTYNYTILGNQYSAGTVTYGKPGGFGQAQWISFSQNGDSGSPVYETNFHNGIYGAYMYGMHLGKFSTDLNFTYYGVYIKIMEALKPYNCCGGIWAVKRG